jgi:hypothetical protein
MRDRAKIRLIAAKVGVKHVIVRHKTVVRCGLFVTVLLIIVAVHEPHVSLLVFCYKALDEFADVVADRVFPASWFDSDGQ